MLLYNFPLAFFCVLSRPPLLMVGRWEWWRANGGSGAWIPAILHFERNSVWNTNAISLHRAEDAKSEHLTALQHSVLRIGGAVWRLRDKWRHVCARASSLTFKPQIACVLRIVVIVAVAFFFCIAIFFYFLFLWGRWHKVKPHGMQVTNGR